MRRLAILAALVCAGCESESKDRGLEILPDMFDTPASKSQTAGTATRPGRDAQGNPVERTVAYPTMAPPPAGTVPREPPAEAADLAAARTLGNPLLATPQVLRHGQRDYLIACAVCHGRDGDAANGYIARQFAGVPSLNGTALLQLADGEIYHIAGHGRGRMPGFAAQLPPERRWAVVHFVRTQARASVLAADLLAQLAQLDAQIAAKPADAGLRERRGRLTALIDQAKADRVAAQAAGDGLEYLPQPAPVPEYQGPQWPVPERKP
jgi:mono/diheme cytochrome c family protein